jgi:dTDP-glucose pyrophosphorylase
MYTKHKLILNSDATFEKAVELIDANGNGFLPVVDENDILLGILTDGDIRKGLIKKKAQISEFVNTNPVTLPHDTSHKKAIQYLKSIKRRHLPLVDENRKLIDVITLDEIDFAYFPNPVVIMAGGLGTRLEELTKDTPKPMLTLGSKPILENIITSFVDNGFKNFYITVNYKAEVIQSYFKDGSEFGAYIKYIQEEKRLGTAGALSLIDKFQLPFFVINGDIITTLDFKELLDYHTKNNADATMCVTKQSYQIPYGVVEFDNANMINGMKEKPCIDYHINAGIYLLSPESQNHIPKDEFFDMPSLFHLLKENNQKTIVYQVNEYWLDVGRKDDYYKAKEDLNWF